MIDPRPTVRADELLRDCLLPITEARILLAFVLGVPRERLIAHPDTPVPTPARTWFADLVQRRAAQEPMPYLLGAREFYGRTFDVSPSVLVPRPETELLVDEALEAIRDLDAPRVLDLGTGSGCIAITLALEHPGAKVTAVDVSDAALQVARDNAQRLRADVRWLQGSWFEPLARDERFDLIVGNPPYVAPGDPHLEALRYEPKIALVSEEQGLKDLRAIAKVAPTYLVDGGWLLLEHGYDQGDALRALLKGAGFEQVITQHDAEGRDRLAIGRKPGRAAFY